MAEVLKEDDDPQQEELVIVEEDPKDRGTVEVEADAGEDERTASTETEEAEVAAATSDKEREAIRERRRLEKQERKQRREEAVKRDKLEMDFLRKRNDDLERRLSAQESRAHQADLRGFDAEIARAQQETELAEKVIAKAVAAGNGEDVAQALKYRDAAMQRAQQLAWQKQQAAQQPAVQANPETDPAMVYAREFIADNSWYDPKGRDEDSAIVLAIDQALGKDGYDPRTEDYWNELRTRVKRRLPDKFMGEKDSPRREERTPRGGPAVGSGREHAPASTRKEVYISAERKEALMEMGVWDDPVLRKKYVKRYAEYDRNNRTES